MDNQDSPSNDQVRSGTHEKEGSDESRESRTSNVSASTSVSTHLTVPESPAHRPSFVPSLETTIEILPNLQQPDDEEAQFYYIAFPSRPRLLGRTSSGITAWFYRAYPPPPGLYPYGPHAGLKRKWLAGPVGPHAIHATWGETRGRVKDALSPLDWTSIDVLRMGPSVPEPTSTVIVWVGVSSRSARTTPWSTLASVLRNVRRILDNDGLDDVECEMRVSDVVRTTGPRLLRPNTMPVNLYDNEKLTTQALTSTVGQSISPRTSPWLEGTLGLYIVPADAPSHAPESTPVWGLTCRHVLIPPEGDVPNSKDDSADTLLPAKSALEDAMEDTNRVIGMLQHETQSNRGAQAEKLDRALSYKNMLESLSSEDARVVGRLHHSPPFTIHRNPTYTCDWALIALDRDRFPRQFNFHNLVDLHTDEAQKSALQNLISRHVQAFNWNTAIPSSNLLGLKGVIPLRELTFCQPAPPHRPTVAYKDESCPVVLKHGGATGVTVGVGTDVMSIVRYPRDSTGAPVQQDSLEWCILHLDGVSKRRRGIGHISAFSAEGDSGAAVFDLTGRVGGLLTAGTRRAERDMTGVDLTYATPIVHVLDDIQRELGVRVRIQ